MRIVGLSILILAVVSACATGLTVSGQFVSDADVGQWQRYAWSEKDSSSADSTVRSADQIIKREVDAQLAEKGYQKTSPGQADFLVRHAIAAHWEVAEVTERELEAMREQELMTGERTTDAQFATREHGEGFLYVILSQPDGKIVWRGHVETPLDYRGQGIGKIPNAIRKVFAEFPARGEG